MQYFHVMHHLETFKYLDDDFPDHFFLKVYFLLGALDNLLVNIRLLSQIHHQTTTVLKRGRIAYQSSSEGTSQKASR